MEFNLTEHGMKANLGYGTLDISGDDEHGFRPFQLMVSSIASCSGVVFQRILEKRRIEFEDITIKADVSRNDAKGNRIEKISLTFIVKGHNLNEENLNKNLKIATKNCAMARSVEGSIEIEERLEVIELSE